MPQISITPDSIQSKFKLAPQQAQQLQRIVIAGMKIMFAPQTRKMLTQALQGNAPIGVKVGQAVAGLLGLINSESQNSVPKNLLIPAGMILCVHACEFLDQSGAKLGDQDVGTAIDAMQSAVMKVAGIDSDKLASMTPEQAKQVAAQPPQGQGIGNTPSPGATMSTAPGNVGHMGSGVMGL